jgi:hypothetical protein
MVPTFVFSKRRGRGRRCLCMGNGAIHRARFYRAETVGALRPRRSCGPESWPGMWHGARMGESAERCNSFGIDEGLGWPPQVARSVPDGPSVTDWRTSDPWAGYSPSFQNGGGATPPQGVANLKAATEGKGTREWPVYSNTRCVGVYGRPLSGCE